MSRAKSHRLLSCYYKNISNRSIRGLTTIKVDILLTREENLHHYTDEAELDGNTVHTTYLRNLICIERQTNMHKTIRKYTFN